MRFIGHIIAAAAILSFCAVSCEKSVKIEESTNIEAELEKKYGRNFELLQQNTIKEKDIDTDMTFSDDKGVEFTVKCRNHTGLAPRVTSWDYTDNYIEKYIEKFGNEYLAGMKENGINVSFTDKVKNLVGDDITLRSKTLIFEISDISQIDKTYEEIEKLDPPLIYSSDILVKSSEDAAFCSSDVIIGRCNYGIDHIKKEYEEIISNGENNQSSSADKNSISSE